MIDGYVIDWSGVAALGAALVALFAAHRSSQISKKNLSASVQLQLIQFRQEWINDLRREIAGFSSAIVTGGRDNNTMKEMQTHAHLIKLMLNPEDRYVAEIEHQLSVLGLRASLTRFSEDSASEILENLEPELLRDFHDKETFNVNALEELGRKILKSEWDRLKRDVEKYHA